MREIERAIEGADRRSVLGKIVPEAGIEVEEAMEMEEFEGKLERPTRIYKGAPFGWGSLLSKPPRDTQTLAALVLCSLARKTLPLNYYLF